MPIPTPVPLFSDSRCRSLPAGYTRPRFKIPSHLTSPHLTSPRFSSGTRAVPRHSPLVFIPHAAPRCSKQFQISIPSCCSLCLSSTATTSRNRSIRPEPSDPQINLYCWPRSSRRPIGYWWGQSIAHAQSSAPNPQKHPPLSRTREIPRAPPSPGGFPPSAVVVASGGGRRGRASERWTRRRRR